MGKPAARATIDQCAHTGQIQSGSPNVLIGGFPAARKGDPVGCSQHGSGIIVGGSASVLVNGLPLARLGDKTQCNTSGAPAVAPNIYWGGSLAEKAGDDGMLHGEKFDLRVLGAYDNSEDKTGDGNYDSASAGFSLLDLTVGNMKSDDLFKFENRNKLAVANLNSSLYGGDSGIFGVNGSGTATAVQYGGTAGLGSQGALYGGVSGDVSIATVESKAIGELYYGNKGRYGFSVEGGSEAALLKPEAIVNIDIYSFIVAEAKFGAPIGGAGVSAGLTAYIDETDYSGNLKIAGELAIILGLKGDVNVKISAKPILKLLYGDDGEIKPSDGDGVILTGCVIVLIGD
jgi:uncharacterized Zn-binding protein involved in type VI secretion